MFYVILAVKFQVLLDQVVCACKIPPNGKQPLGHGNLILIHTKHLLTDDAVSAEKYSDRSSDVRTERSEKF